jgi:hypothetical protein
MAAGDRGGRVIAGWDDSDCMNRAPVVSGKVFFKVGDPVFLEENWVPPLAPPFLQKNYATAAR